MAAPRQMTSETLDAKKGWPRPHAVDFSAKFAAAITSRVPAGSVVHLNSDGAYALGCDSAPLNPMPMFAFNASDDPDVANEGGDASTDKSAWVAIAPTGYAMALVATGAYELYTTNFVPATYAPNDKLTSPLTTANAGKLVAGTLGTNVICGVVSRGVIDNGYGHDALAFWPGLWPVYPE